MIKCIIHCADIHIRNFIRMEEYADQLNKFVEKCKEIAEDYEKDEVRILIAGDLVNSKNNVSNELFTFTSAFLRELEKVAPVIVIAGNHDLLTNNSSRIDTLTALFDTAGFENCKYLDQMLDYESGCVCDDNVVWALYSIIGATLNNGFIVQDGFDGDAFDQCSVVMAGHVHKFQELKRNGIDIVYPSSLIQKDFGETVSQHGFVVWNMEDMTHKFVELETDYGLYDVSIESIEDIDEDKERLINF